MSGNIEDEIVAMKFDNKQFETGVNSSIGSINKLQQSLQFKNAGSGLAGIQAQANSINLQKVADGVGHISKQFNALTFAAKVAFATIVRQGVYAAERFVASFTIDPIKAGFSNYETKINAIQTILSNTSAEGTKLPQVTAALDKLNTYANLTVYNFAEMAKNIGTFTAAGVNLKDSISSIKGIANLAAFSGSTSEQASSAMYQLSQAIAAGQVHLQDWNSVVNAGIGGAVFQKNLLDTALAMGTIDKSQVHLGKTMKDTTINGNAFRQSLTPPPGGTSWLTSDVLTTSLSTFTGDLTKAQLVAKGFAPTVAAAIVKQGKLAQDAATKVKTLSQLFQALKEEVASAYAKVFETLLGNINQAKAIFSPLHQTLENMLTGPVLALNNILEGWAHVGGRNELIEGLKQGFKDLGLLLSPIKAAFDKIFTGNASNNLYFFTQRFHDLMDALEPSPKTVLYLTRIFQGVFSVFKLLGQIVGGVVHYFTNLFGIVGGGSGSFLSLLASVSMLITKFVEWESKNEFIKRFFDTIIKGRDGAITPLIKSIGHIVRALAALVHGHPDLAMKRLGKAFSILKPIVDKVQHALDAVFKTLGLSTKGLDAVFKKLRSFTQHGKEIASALISGLVGGLNAGDLKASIETFASNIVVWIKDKLGIHSPSTEMIPVGYNIATGIAQGIGTGVGAVITAIGKFFGAIGGAIKAFVGQLNLANVLQTVNTGVFVALGFAIYKFVKSLTGVLGSFESLGEKAGGVFESISSGLKTMQTNVRAEIIRKIAISVGILAASIALLASLDPKRMAAGIAAVGGMITGISAAMYAIGGGSGGKHVDTKSIAKKTAQLVALSGAMVAMASAILILSGAVAILGHMKPETLKKGLLAVAAIMTALTVASLGFGKAGGGTLLAGSIAMAIMAVALVEFTAVLEIYANMDWHTIIKGGGAAALVITGLGLSLRAFGKGSFAGSAALLVASAALVILSYALKKIADIGLGNLIKVVIALDLVMTSISVAAISMEASLPGAAAMIVMAAAIIIIAKALQILASIPVLNLLKALGALALMMVIIAGASIILTPIVPLIAGVGTALLIFGAAMFLAGTGMLAFAAGLAVLASIGPAGFAAITTGINILLGLLPIIAVQVGIAIIDFIKTITDAGPVLVKAFATIIGALLDALTGLLPKVGHLIEKLVKVILHVIVSNDVAAAKAMLRFITGMLNAMADGIPKMVDAGTRLILGVIRGLAKNAVKIANGTGKAILEFLRGLDKAIKKYEPKIIAEGGIIAADIIKGLVQGIKDGASAVKGAIGGMASGAIDAGKHFLHINSPSKVFQEQGASIVEGLSKGVRDNKGDANTAVKELANGAIQAMKMTFVTSKGQISALINTSPKITPILDLTNLQNAAARVDAALGRPTVHPTTSRNSAGSIADDHHKKHSGSSGGSSQGNTYNFNQDIRSPEPVNHTKVYRATKSQIALFKAVTD